MKTQLKIILVFIFLGITLVHGQEETGAKLHVAAPVLLESPIRIPEGIDPEVPIPLVIGLHGGGATPEGFLDLWEGIPGADFIFLALQAPYGVSGSPEPAYDWAMWPKGDASLMKRAGGLLPEYASAAIAEVRRQFKVSEVYLVGFSQGAIYTYLIGVGIPDQLEGLLIFGGPGLDSPIHSPFTAEPALPNWMDQTKLEKASRLKVFMAHGRSDPAVDFSLAEESRAALLRNGYEVTFRPFAGGHVTPPEEILTEAVKWIVSR